MQEFATTDVLRLEVLNDPTPGRFLNYVPNDARFSTADAPGGWGWLSPIENTYADIGADGGSLLLRTTLAQSDVRFFTEAMPVRVGATHLKFSFQRHYGGATVGVKARVEFYDAEGATISTSAYTPVLTADNALEGLGPLALPAGTVTLKLRFDLSRAGSAALNANDSVNLRAVTLVQGSLAELGGILVFEDNWTDILGPTANLEIDRAALDLGTLTAAILSPALDPATSATIRKGKALRLTYAEDSASWTPLFTGEILNAEVTYDLAHPDPEKRTRITLTAVDATRPLTAIGRAEGVSSVADLAYVLEGCTLPWNVNGDTGHRPATPPIVALNDNAKALDQVAIVRDTALGAAWVSRAGVLNAWDAADLAARGPAGSWEEDLTEDVYAAADVDYDLDRCINIVTLTYLRLDPATGETEEIHYGPFTDLASVREWGAHERNFTVQGLAEDPATLASYAEAILSANAVPVRRITGATINLRTLADLEAWARIDLYDARRCVATRADLDLTQRVTGLRHKITAAAGDSYWTLEVDFAGEDSVAPPQQVPAPPATGAATLAQLLRPVGEVTMFYGLPANVWPGWLILNGAALTPGEYPALEEWLTLNGLDPAVLPDVTDRVPVGAGVKAVGAKTGAWTKVLSIANLPVLGIRSNLDAVTTGAGRRVTDVGGVTGSGGGTVSNLGAATPLDITPPVIGIYFVIRAVDGAP